MSIKLARKNKTLEALLGKSWFKNKLFADQIPYMVAVNDEIIMNNSGDVFGSFLINGINSFTSDDVEVEDLRNRVQSIVNSLGIRGAIYIHRVTVSDKCEFEPVRTDDFCIEIDKRWKKHLSKSSLVRNQLMLSIVIRPSFVSSNKIIKSLTSIFNKKTGNASIRERRESLISELEDVMRSVLVSLDIAGLKRLRLSEGKWLSMLAHILGQKSKYLLLGREHQPIANLVASAEIFFPKNKPYFTITENNKTRYGAIFGSGGVPKETYPEMLDMLCIPYDITITNSFTPMRDAVALSKMEGLYRQRKAADTSAYTQTEQLLEGADELASGDVRYGLEQLTIQIIADSLEELEIGTSEIYAASQSCGVSLIREKMFLRGAYFSQSVGAFSSRIRKKILTTTHFSDFAALHSSTKGRDKTQSPWGEIITVFPTITGNGYPFNFHSKGSINAEPSAGHTLVLGTTGSGKTLGAAFLACQARRVNARVIVFDKDNGFKVAIKAMGGIYNEVKSGVPTGFNPLATETDDRGIGFLVSWLSTLFTYDRPSLTSQQSEALQNAITEIVMVSNSNLKNFQSLILKLSIAEDGGHLQSLAKEWSEAGRYGWMFSKKPLKGQKLIDLSGDVIGIDMTEILDHEIERTALLAYLFRRIELMVEDRRPTLIILDEAWKLLDDDYFRSRLEDWLVTMRKKNCVVMMLTQTPSQLMGTKIGGIITETVTTRLLFPNPKAQISDYDLLNLNKKEGEFLTSPHGYSSRTALLQSSGDSVHINMDLTCLGGLLQILGGGVSVEKSLNTGWETDPQFWKEKATL